MTIKCDCQASLFRLRWGQAYAARGCPDSGRTNFNLSEHIDRVLRQSGFEIGDK